MDTSQLRQIQPQTQPERKRRNRLALAIGVPALLIIVALLAGTLIKIADPDYRSDAASPAARQDAPVDSVAAEEPSTASKAPAQQGTVEEGRVAREGAPGWEYDLPASIPESAPPVPPAPDKVIKTGELTLAVADDGIQNAYLAAGAIARELGGFVSSSSTGNSAVGGSASVVVRVPASRFEELVERASRLGDVRSLSTSAQDVTGQFVDLEARIRNLEAQRDQILAIMTQAKTVQETIVVQDRLFSVTEQIERLKGQLKALEAQTTYSTLNISIAKASAPPAGDGWGTGKALSRAAHAFIDTLNGFIVLMGPLAFLLILGGLIYAVVRVIWRRRRQPATPAENPEAA